MTEYFNVEQVDVGGRYWVTWHGDKLIAFVSRRDAKILTDHLNKVAKGIWKAARG